MSAPHSDSGEQQAGLAAALQAALGGRSIVLVGMPGSGKSSVGRRLAQRLAFDFVDADAKIEEAANGMSISEIFARHGEPEFRALEARVIARLLETGQSVIATGGGAFMRADTRARVKKQGVSIWLAAEIPLLLERVRRKSNRPLLRGEDPEGVLRKLLSEREKDYAQADITVVSRDIPHEDVVDTIIEALDEYLEPESAEAASMNSVSGKIRTTNVRVELGERGYDIAIGGGLIAEAGARIAKLKRKAKAAIITDDNVAKLYLARCENSLTDAGIKASRIVVTPGESSKSFSNYERVANAILDAGIERGDLVVALGGGVVGDLAGFAAATVLRGVDLVQVPTSLLAQVDSAVGGKTGIDTRHGKNLVGAFHQPILVLADTDILDTLPQREFRSGYAEVAKYGLINDEPFFGWLEQNGKDVFKGGEARIHAVAASCRAKAAIVGRDEREAGERALLNLGHTFAHALEAATGYSHRLLHGEAVSIGIVLAFKLSVKLGLCPEADSDRVAAHLAAVGLPTKFKDVIGGLPKADGLLNLMAKDKKVEHGSLVFILTRGIGRAFVAKGVEIEPVRHLLDEAAREP